MSGRLKAVAIAVALAVGVGTIGYAGYTVAGVDDARLAAVADTTPPSAPKGLHVVTVNTGPILDFKPPTAVSSLTVTDASFAAGGICEPAPGFYCASVFWGKATDNVSVRRYQLMLDGVIAATLSGTARKTPVAGDCPPGTTQTLDVGVAAQDAGGNMGPWTHSIFTATCP